MNQDETQIAERAMVRKMENSKLETIDAHEVLRRDTETLHKFGYAQELSRRMSGFSNFAMAFMIIGVYFAICINIQQGMSTAGMFGISIMWIVGSLLALATSLSLGEISSAIPTAGGLYHWSSVLGGRAWGWATAWINLLSYCYALAGIAVAVYLIFQQMILGWVFHIDTSSWGYWHQLAGVAICIFMQASLNHVGVRFLAILGDVGAYLTFAGAILFFGVLLYNIQPANIAHTFTFTNFSGDAGGGVVPHTDNKWLLYGYALLLPMWINTAYDACAHTSEETIDASRAVPKAMLNSVLLSAGIGFILLIMLAWAMKDPAAIAKQGSNAFATEFQGLTAPLWMKDFIPVTMVLAAFICGACNLTGYSRAVFAFSRDRGLPEFLRKVSHKHRTPAVAIWACSIVGVLATLDTSSLIALAAASALLYQFAYGMAILAGMLAKNRSYGPFTLGVWSKPLGAFAVAGGIFILWVGMQPPTAVLVYYFAAILGLLVVGWFISERRRFPGPPIGEFAIRQRQEEIRAEEAAVGETIAAAE